MTPKKHPQDLHTQKNIHFSETPKNIEIQNFEPPPPKKYSLSLRMYENIRVSPLGFECLTLLNIEVIEYGKKGLQKGLKCILRDIDFKKIPRELPRTPSNERGVPPPLILSPRSRLAPLALA